ncbi:MAG: PQQ-dependent sugar dehydrogenase [Bacteroidota bacterium]
MNKWWTSLCLGIAFFASLGFSKFYFQPNGLSGPVAIGKYLNNQIPSVTPGDGSNLSWSIEPAFPNLQFESPLVIKPHPRQNRLFVASRDGLIEHFVYDESTNSKQTFLDLRTETGVIWDGGFLGLAFHPDFGKAGSPNRNYFYVYYTAKGPNGEEGPFSCNSTCFSCANNGNFFGAYLRLARYTVNEGTLTVNKNTEVQLFNIRAFNGTHRGGGLNFGKDGFLYLAIGDQARRTTAQDIVTNFEGGVIRIDVDKKGGSISHPPRRKMGTHVGESDEFTGNDYYIPNDNPWVVNNNSRFEEFYHNGHRNPHRMTMDRVTGDFWIGEIGAGSKEEITKVKKGQNGGWPIYEGNNFRQFRACGSNNLALGVGTYNPPVVDFLRSETNAIIGGYVYRGAKFPSLYGKYLCGGYSKNRIFVVEETSPDNYDYSTLLNFSPGRLITWGEGPDAELFMGKQTNAGQSTTLFKLKATGSNPPAPIMLSQTGAFSDVANLIPAPGLIPYEMIEPFWSDGANKQRWIAIPNNGTHNSAAEQIQFSEDGNWIFPKGTVMLKHFELGGKRLETRFEVHGENGQYYYLTYKWNEAGTDATLLTEALDEQITVNGQTQIYHYPSTAECFACHQAAAGSVLGLRTRYLNKDIFYPSTGQITNQLVALSSIGAINQNITNAATNNYTTVAAKDDFNQSLELRARSYLDVNCSSCHQPNTGNRAVFDARITTPLANQNYIDGAVIDRLGLTNPALIVEGEVNRSMIHYRMNNLQPNIAMPPLSKNKIDDAGVQVVADWINSLGNVDPDNDNDGVPASQDCNDNDPNLTTVGATCNDGDPNTTNDLVTANCTCEGTSSGGSDVVTESCNDNTISHGNGTITLTSGGTATYFKVLDGNWGYIDNCGWQCGTSFTVTGLAAGDYRVFFENSNYQTICEKVITLGSGGNNGGGGNTDPDNDNDGVPASQDCNDNDANLTTVGASCNDGNPSTNNDVVQANCTCAGTPSGGGGTGGEVTEDCNGNTITHGNGTITLTSNGSAAFFKVLDSGWNTVDNCGWQCGTTFMVTGLPAGDYRIYFDDGNYQTICEKVITLGSGGNNGGGGNTDPDNDNDGVPASQDCNDNDANLTTVGASCNDGNPNTNNDVVQANCTCAGTPNGGGGTGGEVTEDCNDNTITHGNGTITLTSGGDAAFYQILNSSWGPVDHCGWQCSNTFTTTGLPAGRYLIYFQDASYSNICEKWIDLASSSNATAANSRFAPHLSFTAFADSRAVDLQWLTNTSYFNDYFVVEKSTDGEHFEPIERIKSQALGSEMIFNQTVDTKPVRGLNYYRIKQVYRDGDFDYTEVQLVNFAIDVEAWSVFPNPAQDALYLSLKPFVGQSATIQLTNKVGQIVRTKRIEFIGDGTEQLDLRAIENGLYYLMIDVEGRKVIYEKVVVERGF